MKKIALLFTATLISVASFAQTKVVNTIPDTRYVYKNNLQEVFINENTNIMFRSPETIQFVDLSSEEMFGDLPASSVSRVKLANYNEEGKITYEDNQELGVVTIVGESFMAQYLMIYKKAEYSSNITTNIEIVPDQMTALEYPKYELSRTELRYFSMKVLKQKTRKIRTNSDLKMQFILNNVFVVGEFIFLDVTFKNKTNLNYNIDAIKFSIDDKKVYKATNNQSIEIEPIYQLYNSKVFSNSYRNVYVFRKFTFPNQKILKVRLLEEQISGRTLELGIKYGDILNADTL